MIRPLGRATWYRSRATFRRRAGGYLALVVLIGSIGGIAMGALAAARRTQSSFPAYLRSTNPPGLIVFHDDSADDSNATDAAFRAELTRLPGVKHVESATFPSMQLLNADGSLATGPVGRRFDAGVHGIASVDGLFYDMLHLTVVQGRMANPANAGEVVMSRGAARLLGAHVGDRARFGFYTNAQTSLPTYGTGKQKPVRSISARLVGIVERPDAVVQDDFDRSSDFVVFSPALTRPLGPCCSNGVYSGLQLAAGRDVASVERAIGATKPVGPQHAQDTVVAETPIVTATAERAIEPESIALGVFGGIAALAALLIAGLAISRQLGATLDQVAVLRSMGAGPWLTSTDGLLGVAGAIVAGALLAALVAVAVSPLAPIGPVRPVYPWRGVSVDRAVIGGGMLVLILVLNAVAIVVAYRGAPHRVERRSRLIATRRSNVARAAAASGLSAPAVAGLGFALERGRGHDAAPVRSAMLGAVLAVVVVVTTLTFGSSLNTLVARPALYGWNWNYELLGQYGGFADVPEPKARRLLARDPDVAATADVSFDVFHIDRLTVPVLGATPRARVGPRVLSGHALDSPRQIVFGPTTLAQLHKHIGDTVTVDTGSASVRLVIVGTATLPAIGVESSLHLEMGTGAVLATSLIPAADRGFGDLPGSPEAVLVRFKPGTDPAAARRTLRTIVAQLNVLGHGAPLLVPVQRPAEIVNYRAIAITPSLVGLGLAAGAVIALGLTLLSSVRRRRRDLALLKTLGFTRRQLAATVAWQSTVAVGVGVVVGLPLGALLGRALWDRFAVQLHVVPLATIPGPAIALVALGAVVLANVVAAFPGHQAASTKTAVLLHSE